MLKNLLTKNKHQCKLKTSLLPPTKVKFGFTLAEVLITLGIVGVVAAMTIPTLISKNQKRVIEAKLKEDYSIIQQVIKSNEGNDVDMSMILQDGNTDSQKEWFETYFAPYMKYSHVCYETKGCWQKNKTKLLTGATVAIDRPEYGIGAGIVSVTLNNGTNITMDVWSGTNQMRDWFGIDYAQTGMSIFIDANGNSGPNVVGKDIYILTYTPDYGILPAGFHKTKEEVNNNCSKNDSSSLAGYFCLLRVKNNGWSIPDDVWNLKI